MFLAVCRRRQKVFLDFIRRIRYNSYVVDTCRCVGMADEGDSKSLVLITRVGSTPTTGIKRKPSSLSGGLPFYLRRVSGSNSTTPHSRGSNQPCGLLLSARETPTSSIGPKPPHSKSLSFDAFHPAPNLISRSTKALPLGCERQGFVMRLFPAASRDTMLPHKLCGAARRAKPYSAMGMVW